MGSIISQEGLAKALDWAYDKAVNGVPGLGTAEELAQDYLSRSGSRESCVESLINWQVAKCATSGFITGLGGAVMMPVTIPANISSVLYVQVKMIAAIAHIGGHDIRCDQVKSMVYLSLCGQSAANVAKEVGIEAGKRAGMLVIKKIPGEAIKAINKAVGFRLITKFGNKGVVNLGKGIPGIGGLVGAGFDGFTTRKIGKTAKKIFIDQQL